MKSATEFNRKLQIKGKGSSISTQLDGQVGFDVGLFKKVTEKWETYTYNLHIKQLKSTINGLSCSI